VLVKLVHRIFALLVAATYIGAVVAAAAPPVGSCPAPEGAARTAHHHHSGHNPPHHSSDKTAEECLKCCLGACLVTPCLPGPTTGVSSLAFVGTPVLYWVVTPAISARATSPDPGPPKLIA
jgi:hypothetical protein